MSLKFQIKEEENTKIHNTFIKFQVQIQFAGRIRIVPKCCRHLTKLNLIDTNS